MTTTPSWDEYFLTIAQAVSLRAKCTRRKVGAVLVDEKHRIVSTGYNGMPTGVRECNEGGCPRGKLSHEELAPDMPYTNPKLPSYCPAVHAELNSLLYAGRYTTGCSLYVTDKPCPDCSRFLAGAGVVRVVWPTGELNPRELYQGL